MDIIRPQVEETDFLRNFLLAFRRKKLGKKKLHKHTIITEREKLQILRVLNENSQFFTMLRDVGLDLSRT